MPKRAKNNIPTKTTSFWNSLEKALKKFEDTAWLGQNSPLATPYFLGPSLEVAGNRPTDSERGRALKSLFQQATEKITGKDADRYRSILTKYYFQNSTVTYMLDHMGLGNDAFHTHRKRAISALEKIIIELVRPSLRLEARPVIRDFFGYYIEIDACQKALQNRESIAVTGDVGRGKTAFGSFVTQAYTSTKTFWYTIHPGLNDQRNTLLFTLSYFFHTCGSSALWLQLVADGEQMQQELIPGLLNFTLAELQDDLPILCFDQIDRLRPTENSEHAAIIALLNSLKNLTPLIFMGDQVPIEADTVCPLTYLSLTATKEWFSSRELSLSFSDLEKIYTHTNGNPRLLELFISLATNGQQMENCQIEPLLSELSNNLSVDFMLRRIMSRLNEIELKILIALSVFRHPAPADVWTSTKQEAFALNRILRWNLVLDDGQGGIALLPIYRATIYNGLPPETRELLHDQAANIRAERGAYTSAAYHLIQSGAAEEAILLWHEHRQQEIEQGQARMAFALWRNISSSRLSQVAKEYLHKIQSELEMLFGDYTGAKTTLDSIEWKSSVMQIFAAEQEALIAIDENRLEAAQSAYQRALQKIESVIESRLVHIHKNMAHIHIREQNLNQVEHEVQRARYETSNIQGDLRDRQGNWDEAAEHYLVAYALAEGLNYKEGLAKTANNLANVYEIQGQIDIAVSYRKRAIEYYEQMGKVTAIAGMKVNLAAYHNEIGEHHQAIDAASEASKIFGQLLNSWGQAMANQNLSESHLALGNLDQAETCSRAVIESEEITLLPDAYRVFGEIAAQRGDFATAEKFINDSIQLSQSNEDIWLEAYAHRALGKVYQLQQQLDQADAAFDKALELFEALKLENEMATTVALKARS